MKRGRKRWGVWLVVGGVAVAGLAVAGWLVSWLLGGEDEKKDESRGVAASLVEAGGEVLAEASSAVDAIAEAAGAVDAWASEIINETIAETYAEAVAWWEEE